MGRVVVYSDTTPQKGALSVLTAIRLPFDRAVSNWSQRGGKATLCHHASGCGKPGRWVGNCWINSP
jgi:hypothetical protein